MSRRKLLLLADSSAYIRENCYQHQLLETLETTFDVRLCSVREIRWNPFLRVSDYDVVLSVLKQRTLARFVDPVRALLKGRSLVIYDQDPWQAFINESPTRGCYSAFCQKLNVKSILLTSQWWADFCQSREIPAHFVRMGMLPQYCEAGPGWDARSIDLGFQGTLHPHRKVFFDALEAMGLKVDILPSRSYQAYLKTLHQIKIYIHTEDAPWMVGGTLLPRNALWIKDVEVAARGCFAIRNWDEDFDAYDIAHLPTISAFRSINEIPQLVASIHEMSGNKRQQLIEETIAKLRQRDDWRTVIRALD